MEPLLGALWSPSGTLLAPSGPKVANLGLLWTVLFARNGTIGPQYSILHLHNRFLVLINPLVSLNNRFLSLNNRFLRLNTRLFGLNNRLLGLHNRLFSLIQASSHTVSVA